MGQDPGRVEVLRDVPESEKARIEGDFVLEGATVESVRQPDGKWTIHATFPGAIKVAGGVLGGVSAPQVGGMFSGQGKPLSATGLSKAAGDMGIQLPVLWAVITVETKGCGFLPDRRPVILFERHVFHERTNGKFDGVAPDLSNPTPGEYGPGGAFQYDRLKRAVALDRKAALESASWGLGQIMGYHAPKVGFTDIEAMVKAMADSEDVQLQGMVGFIAENKLSKLLQQKDWAGFARRYNGPNFAKNEYDKKLAQENARFEKEPLPDLTLRSAQLLLVYRGFKPGPVDGFMGSRTEGALKEFQKAKNLPVTGKVDSATAAALQAP